MTFDEAMRQAAHVATDAARATSRQYRSSDVHDEDDITGVFIGQLEAHLKGNIGSLHWNSKIFRHRSGVAAEEKFTGADFALIIRVSSPILVFEKGLLVQAKRAEYTDVLRTADKSRMDVQCRKMLDISAASFIANYRTDGFRFGSATRVVGSKDRQVAKDCPDTPYRFFLNFFQCPTGDPKLTLAYVRSLTVPRVLELTADGEFSGD